MMKSNSALTAKMQTSVSQFTSLIEGVSKTLNDVKELKEGESEDAIGDMKKLAAEGLATIDTWKNGGAAPPAAPAKPAAPAAPAAPAI